MPDDSVTVLLTRWRAGDRQALDELTPLVYTELRRIARRHLRREPAGNSLQTTALVHEAYLKLVDQSRIEWQNRAQFCAVVGSSCCGFGSITPAPSIAKSAAAE